MHLLIILSQFPHSWKLEAELMLDQSKSPQYQSHIVQDKQIRKIC